MTKVTAYNAAKRMTEMIAGNSSEYEGNSCEFLLSKNEGSK
jgi:hypothetical protein